MSEWQYSHFCRDSKVSLFMVFLGKDLEDILRSLMTRLIRCAKITEATTTIKLLQIDVEDYDNNAGLEKVNVGHAAEKALSLKCLLRFLLNCRQFLVNMTLKLLEKYPNWFYLVRGLTCFEKWSEQVNEWKSPRLF